MDENIPITILKEDENEDIELLNTGLLFDDSVYPNSKVTTDELEHKEDDTLLNNIKDNSLLSSIKELNDNEIENNKEDSGSENNDSIVSNSIHSKGMSASEDNSYEASLIIEEDEKIESVLKPDFKQDDIKEVLLLANKKIEELTKTNINTTLPSIETRALNFLDRKEDNSIYIAKINALEEKVKEYSEQQAKKIETKYSFMRTNKINIIENYIKKYNLKYEFKREQLLELDDDEFNKIYYNIYNINESRKNSLIYYGVCFFIIWVVDFAYNKIHEGSNRKLFQKFTFEVFHDNLSDSFVMFENEYFPTNDKLGSPILNIGKFLLYFCFINLIFDSPPSNLKI